MTATTEQKTRTPWRAVTSLGLGAFIIVSAEFLPVGMLPDMAHDLGVSLGLASAVVLIPGIVAGIASPVVVTSIRGLDRRILILALTTILVLSNVITWIAPNFTVVLLARILVGVALGGFWAVGPSLGVRLAAPGEGKVATSLVLAGISAGTVLALPLGQAVAAAAGWRTVYIGAAIAGLIVVLLQLFWLPPIKVESRVKGADLMAVLRASKPRAVLIVTIVAFTAQFMGSTYISAYLGSVATFNAGDASIVLLVYSGLGLAGNLLAPRVKISLPRIFGICGVAVGIVFLLLPHVPGIWVLAGALVFVWGFFWGAVPFLMQTWTMSTVPKSPEAGSSVLITFLQAGIAIGGALGGITITLGGLAGTFTVAGILYLVAACLALAPAASTQIRDLRKFARAR